MSKNVDIIGILKTDGQTMKQEMSQVIRHDEQLDVYATLTVPILGEK